MSLALIIYLADMANSISCVLNSFGLLFILAGGFYAIALHKKTLKINREIIELNRVAYLSEIKDQLIITKNFCIKCIKIGACMLGVSIFIPAQSSLYMMAASQIAPDIAKNVTDMPEMAKLRKVINIKLDEIIKDGK